MFQDIFQILSDFGNPVLVSGVYDINDSMNEGKVILPDASNLSSSTQIINLDGKLVKKLHFQV